MTLRVHSATIFVRDQAKARAFYTDALGWEVRVDNQISEESRFLTVAPKGSDAEIALIEPAMYGEESDTVRIGGRTGISLIADDVQATYDELVAKGVGFTEPPAQMPWGGYATTMIDLDGNTIYLAGG